MGFGFFVFQKQFVFIFLSFFFKHLYWSIIALIHFVIKQKLTHHRKAIILPWSFYYHYFIAVPQILVCTSSLNEKLFKVCGVFKNFLKVGLLSSLFLLFSHFSMLQSQCLYYFYFYSKS